MIGLRGCARLSAVAIALISFKETLHPRRWTYSDLFYFVPVLVCAIMASLPSRQVSYRTRAMAGFYIGLGFLFALNDDRSLAQDDMSRIIIRSLCCIIASTAIFAGVTECISRLLRRPEREWRFCQNCGYCLLGLIDPRCPECGSPIPEEQAKELAAMQTRAKRVSGTGGERDRSGCKPA